MYEKNYLNLVFSTKDQTAQTPEWMWELIAKSIGVAVEDVFDPCPPNPTQDGLEIPWGNFNIVNPPFKDAAKWLQKGLKELDERGAHSVFILPFRPNRRYFHEALGAEGCTDFLVFSRRIVFKGYKRPFPGAICLICIGAKLSRKVWTDDGFVEHTVPLLMKSLAGPRGYQSDLDAFVEEKFGSGEKIELVLGSPKATIETRQSGLYMTLPFVQTDYFQNSMEKVSCLFMVSPVLVLEGYVSKSLLGTIVLGLGSTRPIVDNGQTVTFLK